MSYRNNHDTEVAPTQSSRRIQPAGNRKKGKDKRPREHQSGQYQFGYHQSGQHQSGQYQSGQHQSGKYQLGYHQSGQPQFGQLQFGEHLQGLEYDDNEDEAEHETEDVKYSQHYEHGKHAEALQYNSYAQNNRDIQYVAEHGYASQTGSFQNPTVNPAIPKLQGMPPQIVPPSEPGIVSDTLHRVPSSMIAAALRRHEEWKPMLPDRLPMITRHVMNPVIVPAEGISIAVLDHCLRPKEHCQSRDQWDHVHFVGFDASITAQIKKQAKRFMLDGLVRNLTEIELEALKQSTKSYAATFRLPVEYLIKSEWNQTIWILGKAYVPGSLPSFAGGLICSECSHWSPYGFHCVGCRISLPDQSIPKYTYTCCKRCNAWSDSASECAQCHLAFEDYDSKAAFPVRIESFEHLDPPSLGVGLSGGIAIVGVAWALTAMLGGNRGVPDLYDNR